MLPCRQGLLQILNKKILGLDGRALIISAIVHILIFFGAWYCSRGSKEKLEFVVYGAYSRQPSQVLFKGLPRGTGAVSNKLTSSNQAKKKLGKIKEVSKKTATKKAMQKKAKKKAKGRLKKKGTKKVLQPEKKGNGPAIKDQELADALAAEKAENLKKKRKKKEVKVASVEPKKEALQPKKEIKKEEPKKEEQEEVQEQVDTQKVEEPDIENMEFVVNNEHLQGVSYYNLMGSDDSKMLVIQNEIQDAISDVWAPPVGVKKGTEARVRFTVDSTGKIVEFEVEVGSGIVIFDSSIMRSAAQIKFPKAVWGRSFPITYQQ